MNNWFLVRAMATEGDLTVGQNTLNKVAENIADAYLNGAKILNYYTTVDYCNLFGFDYDSLLEEEKDYLNKKIEGLINYKCHKNY